MVGGVGRTLRAVVIACWTNVGRRSWRRTLPPVGQWWGRNTSAVVMAAEMGADTSAGGHGGGHYGRWVIGWGGGNFGGGEDERRFGKRAATLSGHAGEDGIRLRGTAGAAGGGWGGGWGGWGGWGWRPVFWPFLLGEDDLLITRLWP